MCPRGRGDPDGVWLVCCSTEMNSDIGISPGTVLGTTQFMSTYCVFGTTNWFTYTHYFVNRTLYGVVLAHYTENAIKLEGLKHRPGASQLVFKIHVTPHPNYPGSPS